MARPAADDEDGGDGGETDAAAARFIDALIARGEAAEADEHGELPDHATHEIFTDEHGRRRVRRRRFFNG